MKLVFAESTWVGPLKYALLGYWSRRITDEHPMVHRVQGGDLQIAQLRSHE